MSTMERRLERLYPALSAKERAMLVLRAWREGKKLDPCVRSTIPWGQVPEYNRLTDLMIGANKELTWYITLEERAVSGLRAFTGWLLTCQLWSLNSATIADYIGRYTKEPITKSEYEKLAKGRRSGTPTPRWGESYEVYPDDQQAEVLRLRKEREQVRDDLLGVPFPDEPLLPEPKTKAQREHTQMWREMGQQLEKQVVESIRRRWQEIRAVEIALEEAKAELQGEDPLHFAIREKLEEAKRTVKEMSEALMWAVGDDLPEPDESLLDGVRGLLERRGA